MAPVAYRGGLFMHWCPECALYGARSSKLSSPQDPGGLPSCCLRLCSASPPHPILPQRGVWAD